MSNSRIYHSSSRRGNNHRVPLRRRGASGTGVPALPGLQAEMRVEDALREIGRDAEAAGSSRPDRRQKPGDSFSQVSIKCGCNK